MILAAFEREFRLVDARSRELIAGIDGQLLFTRPRDPANSLEPASCGEYLIRSAAMVEKAFGGITTRLWDDPFEWTLPEELATKPAILQYLDEVEATRSRGFAFLSSDDDLGRQIPAPERLRPIFTIILEALVLAAHYQGRAFAAAQAVAEIKLPRL